MNSQINFLHINYPRVAPKNKMKSLEINEKINLIKYPLCHSETKIINKKTNSSSS